MPGMAEQAERIPMKRTRLMKRVYRIGGSPILAIHSNCPAALDAIELRQCETPEAASLSPMLEIFLLGGGFAERAWINPPVKADTVYTSEGVSILSEDGRHFGNWYGKASSVSDLQTGRAVISVPGFRYYNPDFIVRYIFRPVLDRMFLDRGWLPLHSAAVAKDGRGCLLVGATGSGKTTMLLKLLEKGMDFFADDRALVREDKGGFHLHAFPERMRIAVTALGRKHSLAAPEPIVSTVEMEMIIFLGSDRSGAFQMDRIGAAEASARLLQSVSPYMGSRERGELISFVDRLCRGTVCYSLRGWGDPWERAIPVINLLREGISR